MIAGNGDDKVVVRRRIVATREELFDAWIDPEGMRDWMCPGDVTSADIQMDPRVGGKLHVLMKSPTETHEHTGEFRVVERPSKLQFTWTAKNLDGRISLVTVELIEVSATDTELVLTHQHIPKKEVRERYQSGWTRIVGLLEKHMKG